VTLKAGEIIGTSIVGERLVGIVAGDTGDAVVSLLPTLAVLQPVRREPNVENSQVSARQHVFPCTVAGTAEVYRIDAVQASGVENERLARLRNSRVLGGYVTEAGTMTSFAGNSGNERGGIKLSFNSRGRSVATETELCFFWFHAPSRG